MMENILSQLRINNTCAVSSAESIDVLQRTLSKDRLRLETDSSEVVTQVVDHIVCQDTLQVLYLKKKCKVHATFYKDELAVITPDTPEYRILKEQNRDDIDWIKGNR